MLKNQDIICFSSIDWDFNWQGHQQLMATFANSGNRVLFVENTGVRPPKLKDIHRLRQRLFNWAKGPTGIRQVQADIYIYSPLLLPFPYSFICRKINKRIALRTIRRWMKAVGFSSPIIFTFLPTPLVLELIDALEPKISVYYCIADFIHLSSRPKKIGASEKSLLKACDVVFAQGEDLSKRCKEYNQNVSIFPFGVSLNVFDCIKTEETPANDIFANLSRPIAGYVGAIHKHIDFELLEEMVKKYSDWSFVFIGPVQKDIPEFKRLKNMHFLGERPHKELPFYIDAFDVCLIPYLKSAYTRTVYPTKLNEYLILGKPVVSTDLPEIRSFNNRYGNVVKIGKDRHEFLNLLSQVVGQDNSEDAEKRKKVARSNSWETRIEEMSDIIDKAILEKRRQVETGWVRLLKRIYWGLYRRFFKTALAMGLIWILVFHTPFVWFLSKPFIISQEPRQADAIVVFGGGVGETGNPGKSTIERARYAVELCRAGYSDNIIFSSGYTYFYSDAENMKLFALSMGMPKEAITLEEKSGSTYENITYVKKILDKKGWRSILLISSPYHMRRASLVFRKQDPGREVIYTPVPHCQFYDRSRPIKLEQIRALWHEAAGIVYYTLKGYI